MDDVTKHPQFHNHGNVYYFRGKIPADFLLHLSQSKERLFSLRTSNWREAEDKVRIESVKFDKEMAQARRAIDAQPKTALSHVEEERICAIFYHRLLHENDIHL